MQSRSAYQLLLNFKAQLNTWDARIERYQSQISAASQDKKEALLDELIHLKAKRDQLYESFTHLDQKKI